MIFATIRLALLCSVSLLPAACAGPDSGNTATPTIDTSVVAPAVLERLQQGEALVYVALRRPGVPVVDEAVEDAQEHAATVQASVLSVLTEDDLRLTHQFPITPGLGGYITMSGVEKLAGHPDVRAIVLSAGATLPEDDPGG